MSINKKSKQLAVDTVLFGISTFGSKILIFLLTPLYTAVLLTEEYGIADIITTTVNILYPIFTLAITDATLRYALDKNVSSRKVLNNSVMILMVSVLVLMACFPVVARTQLEITEQLTVYWPYFVCTYAAFNLHNCFANFVKGIGKTKLFALQGILQTVTVILCNIYFLLIAKIGLKGYLMSVIIGHVVPTVWMFFAGKLYGYLYPVRLDGPLMKDMLRYSIPMIPTLLAWSILMSINKFMLISILPAEIGLGEAGIFSVANKVPSMLTAVLSIFTQAWQLSAISNVNDSDESEYYTKVYTFLHLISMIGCLMVLPLSKWLSALLFDPSYYTAWRHIPFLTLSAFFSCLCGFLASAFRAYKKTHWLVLSVTAGAIISVVVNWQCIMHVGVIGASFAAAIGFFVTWIVRIITIQKLVTIRIPLWKTVIVYFLLFMVSALISFDIKGAYFSYGLTVITILCLYINELRALLQIIMNTITEIMRRFRK